MNCIISGMEPILNYSKNIYFNVKELWNIHVLKYFIKIISFWRIKERKKYIT